MGTRQEFEATSYHNTIGIEHYYQGGSPSDCKRDRVSQLIPAAEYLRMSDDHQQYSPANQRLLIRNYALAHNFVVTKTYVDEARSGLQLKNRPSLSAMLQDVLSGSCGYKAILVYDVSRWGRFQDVDEHACYEFLCRQCGISVHYCAESFGTEDAAVNSLMKNVKRTMAAEFSRQLGLQVFDAKASLARQGFRVGGAAPFGFRRMMISDDSTRNRPLKAGELKNLRSDKIVLVPGPANELRWVRKIFRMLLNGSGPIQIAEHLNKYSCTRNGKSWISNTVRNLLRNPAYTGANVWARTSQKLGGPNVSINKQSWIIKPHAFHSIIADRVFEHAQEVLRERTAKRRLSDKQLLEKLGCLLAKKGRLSEDLIDKAAKMPDSKTYRQHFGSLAQAYAAVGFEFTMVSKARSRNVTRALALRRRIIAQLVKALPDHFKVTPHGPGRPLLFIDNIRLSLLLCPSFQDANEKWLWRVDPIDSERKFVTLIGTLNRENDNVSAFYVFPKIDLPQRRRHQMTKDDPWLQCGKKLNCFSQLYETVREIHGTMSAPTFVNFPT